MKEGLRELRDRGALGEHLVNKFGGERGDVPPSADSDFLLIYPDDSRVPTAKALKDAVDQFFQSRGFTMLRPTLGNNSYVVSAEDLNKHGLGMTINITVGYPYGNSHRAVWVSTNILT